MQTTWQDELGEILIKKADDPTEQYLAIAALVDNLTSEVFNEGFSAGYTEGRMDAEGC